MKPTKFESLRALAPNSKFVTDGDGTILNSKLKNGDSLPTEEAIQTKLATMISDWEAQEYARNRASEYPSLLELTVALYDTDDKSAVEAKRASVKLKYPKPS